MALDRDPGMAAAIAAAGSVSALARALGVRRQSLRWRRVPQTRVFEVSGATGVAPDVLRPDLSDWIDAERLRQRLAQARARHSLVRAAAGGPGVVRAAARQEDEFSVDILTALAAVRFVAAERDLSPAAVLAGADKAAAAARSLAGALAHVAGRARSAAVASLFGVSRQNIDNASERYLRARDGDDPETYLVTEDGVARVIERGRVRRAKTATEDLWDLERRFLAFIDGVAAERRTA